MSACRSRCRKGRRRQSRRRWSSAPCQVFEGDLGLPLEDPVYVVAPALERHVPLAHVADTPGVLEKGRGHQGDVAQCHAAEVRDHGPAGRTSDIHIGLDRGQVGLGQRLEFLEIVVDVQVIVVEVMSGG